MNCSSNKHGQRGITLVESLITVVIISTTFISLTKLQLNMWKTTQDTQLIEMANSLAYTKMDELGFQFSHTSSAQGNGSITKTRLNTSFITSWQTQTLESGALKIQIEVTWRSKSIRVETTQHPVNQSIRRLFPTQKSS